MQGLLRFDEQDLRFALTRWGSGGDSNCFSSSASSALKKLRRKATRFSAGPTPLALANLFQYGAKLDF